MGAVTVVLSSNASDPPLSPEKLLEAISQQAFHIFSLVYVIGASILMGLSEGSAGRKWVLVDVGLCALFGAQDSFIHAGSNIKRDIQGGFTVLSTKAISTLLTTRGFEMFKEWMTYPVLAVSSLTMIVRAILDDSGAGSARYWRWPDKIP
jgi:hypothetical protein